MSIGNLDFKQIRIINLFQNHFKIIDIANRIHTSRQYVSSFLKHYYEFKRPLEYCDLIEKRRCIICNIEENIVIEKVPLYIMDHMTYKEKVVKRNNTYIHPECENLYRCSACGTIGYLGFYITGRMKKHSCICNQCSKDRVYAWMNKDPDNRKSVLDCAKRWRINNKEKFYESVKRSRRKHQEYYDEYHKQYYIKNKEEICLNSSISRILRRQVEGIDGV